jgi:phage FluMu protein Com
VAIFRCNGCGHLREVTNDYIGKSVKCPNCKKPNSVHDTVRFLEKVIGKYIDKSKELHDLQNNEKSTVHLNSSHGGQSTLTGLDIFNTSELASYDQYGSILSWFNERQIELEIDHKAVDTRGFFDEVAVELGDNYDTLKHVTNQIKFAQGKSFTRTKIELSKKSTKEAKEIVQFCKLLYEYSFVARFSHDKKENAIWLALQTANTITRFFNGVWAEWFVFMKLLSFFREIQIPVSCLRSLELKHSNEESNELDVFFLIGDMPLCIECKSGEYRHDIQKYSNLRKRLKLDNANFLLFAVDLDDDQLQGMNSMYDITFVNPNSLISHVEQLIPK